MANLSFAMGFHNFYLNKNESEYDRLDHNIVHFVFIPSSENTR